MTEIVSDVYALNKLSILLENEFCHGAAFMLSIPPEIEWSSDHVIELFFCRLQKKYRNKNDVLETFGSYISNQMEWQFIVYGF